MRRTPAVEKQGRAADPANRRRRLLLSPAPSGGSLGVWHQRRCRPGQRLLAEEGRSLSPLVDAEDQAGERGQEGDDEDPAYPPVHAGYQPGGVAVEGYPVALQRDTSGDVHYEPA